MPEPIRRTQRYMPGLDGLRAIAVLAVVAYHLELSFATGGLLGVGVFFTLSGYLITDLLLSQHRRADTIRLGAFWMARARRLLPALYLMLAVVIAWVVLVGPSQPPQFREAVGATALYVANWQLILQHLSYFTRFGPPAPLDHLWSLGVEEQFYILWPLLLMLGLRLVRERSPASGLRPRLALLTLVLAGVSALEMALLYRPGFDSSRVYFGTDTRAFELLAGAALAMVWPSAHLTASVARGARIVIDSVGASGLIGICLMVGLVGEYSPFLYEGGFVLLSLATVGLVACLAHPASRLGGLLGWAPLRWVGERSYGIYLWHLPIIALTTPAGAHGASALRDVLQVAATLVVAALSWRYVEQPIRHGALAAAWRHLRACGLRVSSLPRRGWAIATAVACLVAISVIGMSGVGLRASSDESLAASASASISRTASVPLAGLPASLQRASGTSPTSAAAADTPSGMSSCRAVVHIGDSTSEGLISHDYIPRPQERIEAQYARVGATVQHYEISGARSIVERYDGQPNAYEAAQRWKQSGYHGCWVLAIGANDAADVAVGSHIGLAQRVKQMMSLLGSEPVMWVNVKSLLSSGPYAEGNMQAWDDALRHACGSYPNMRIFNWAAVVKDSWFIADGIHFNTPGYIARSRLIAQALAQAFPASGQDPGCVVG